MSERSSEIHRRQLEDVADLSEAAIETLMLTLATYPIAEWARVLRGLLPDLVETFGEAAGILAIQYYNDRREIILAELVEEDKAFNKVFEATDAMIPRDKIREGVGSSIDYFIGKLFKNINNGTYKNIKDADAPVEYLDDLGEEEIASLTQELKNQTSRDVKNFSRETIEIASNADPAPIEPVRSVNDGGCPWCKFLHVQGKMAGNFHTGCNCDVDLLPARKVTKATTFKSLVGLSSARDTKKPTRKVTEPSWYDEYQEAYNAASKSIGSSKPSDVLYEMERLKNL